jgi:hypothetical protein
VITYTCPSCEFSMQSPDSMAGGKEACPACGNVTIVPHQIPVPKPKSPIPRMPTTEAAQPATITVKMKSANGLGIASLVIGIIAILGCWIPFINATSMILAILGCILGGLGLLISLLGQESGVGLPVSGMITCAIAIAVACAVTMGSMNAMDELQREIEAAAESPFSEEQPERPSATSPRRRPQNRNPSMKETWISAAQVVRCGDAEIQIKKVVLGKVALISAMNDKGMSKDELLMVYVKVNNINPNKKMNYRSWRGAGYTMKRDFAVLKDNHGNSYKESLLE